AVAGVADAAAEPTRGGERAVAADHDASCVQVGAIEGSPDLDGVEPNAGALVDRRVAGEGAACVDGDLALAGGVDAAARVAGPVVADRRIVQRERERSGRRGALHAAAVGGRD